MAEGWIKLYRRALQTPALQSAMNMGLWTTLLLKASHRTTQVDWKGQTVELAPGQLAVSVRSLARSGEVTHKTIRHALDRFEREGMIEQSPILGTVKGTGRGTVGTLITIRKFDNYQSREEARGTVHGTEEGTAGAQQGHTEQEGKEFEEGRELDSKHRLNGDADGRRREMAAYRQALDREFLETFWPAYPAKVAKPAAKKAYHRARGTHPQDVIMRGLEAYKRVKPSDRSWMHPATFLNQERFNDEHGSDQAERDKATTASPRREGTPSAVASFRNVFGRGH